MPLADRVLTLLLLLRLVLANIVYVTAWWDLGLFMFDLLGPRLPVYVIECSIYARMMVCLVRVLPLATPEVLQQVLSLLTCGRLLMSVGCRRITLFPTGGTATRGGSLWDMLRLSGNVVPLDTCHLLIDVGRSWHRRHFI